MRVGFFLLSKDCIQHSTAKLYAVLYMLSPTTEYCSESTPLFYGDVANKYVFNTQSFILSLLILSSAKSFTVYKVAYNFSLFPNILTVAGIGCCFSVIGPLLVATKLQAPGRIPTSKCCSPCLWSWQLNESPPVCW